MLTKNYRLLLYPLAILYFIILTKLILFKSQIGTISYGYMSGYSFRENLHLINLVPLKGIINVINSGNKPMFIVQNIAGNIIGFIPLGILIFFFLSRVTVYKALKISFFTSLFYEVVQIIFVLGHFDVDDLLLNSLGGVLGYLLAKILVILYDLPLQNGLRPMNVS